MSWIDLREFTYDVVTVKHIPPGKRPDGESERVAKLQKTATRPADGQPGGASEKTAQQDGHPPHSVLGKTSTLLCGSVVSTKTATPQKTSAASSTAAE